MTGDERARWDGVGGDLDKDTVGFGEPRGGISRDEKKKKKNQNKTRKQKTNKQQTKNPRTEVPSGGKGSGSQQGL